MQNHVLDYLSDIVKKCPDKLAFSDGKDGLTFKNIFDISRSIGSFLYEKNIRKSPVVIFMNRHPNTVAAFYGTIMGGSYYVPIDSEMPSARIELILKNVSSPLMICDEDNMEEARKLDFDGEIVSFDTIGSYPVNEKGLKEIYDKSIDTDPLYIVFTSGSTGVPKGVVANHRSVLDYVEQLSESIGFNENTIFGSQTPLYVDACLKELFPTLKFGATTYLIPKELFMFPIKLVEYLNEYKINTICWVVSALTIISALGTFKTVKPEYLTTICFGSESFPIKQFKRWREAVPDATYFNLYGPTEATGMSCYYKVDRDFELDEVIPVGRPFKNTEIMLLDDEGHLAPPGEPGEICIRGTAVTLGYYNNPEKTGEVFVQNPLNPHYPELIYKTGDLGRFNERGELEFISRKDYQIKHMGYRIELGEIEANVNALDEVEMTGCIYDKAKDKIVLYYVGSSDEKQMTEILKDKLPGYMLPNKTIKLDIMPLTSNGKIDRVSLKEMYERK